MEIIVLREYPILQIAKITVIRGKTAMDGKKEGYCNPLLAEPGNVQTMTRICRKSCNYCPGISYIAFLKEGLYPKVLSEFIGLGVL